MKGAERKGVAVAEGRAGEESCSFDDDKSCRLCFEGDTGDRKNPLVSPCRCKGTSEFVHLECLRKWQRICSNDVRAWVCSVCKSPYSIEPTPLGMVAKFWTTAQKACANLALLAFFSQLFPSSPGSVAFFILAALYSFLYVDPAVTLAVISLRLVTMLVFSLAPETQLQLIWQVSTRAAGGANPFGLALVRYGESVPGLGLGSLLVSSRELDGSIFERSVVFIYAYDRRLGAEGVILNKGPIASTPSYSDSYPWSDSVVSRYIGGPVGLPTTDQMSSSSSSPVSGSESEELVALHRHQEQLLESSKVSLGIQGPGGENTTTTSDYVMYSSSPSRLHAFLERLQDSSGSIERDKMRVFHGKASWAGGQLEGEVRASAWTFCNATIADLFETPTELLWDSLTNGDRLNGISS